MNTDILLISRPDNIMIYNIAGSIYFGLLKNNINCKIVDRFYFDKFKDNLWLLTIHDIQLYFKNELKFPKYYILLQTEPIKYYDKFNDNLEKYKIIAQNSQLVLEYSKYNIDFDIKYNIPYSIFYTCFTGYYEIYYDFFKLNKPEKYDILFYGCMTPRREAVIDKLKEKLKCFIVYMVNERRRNRLCEETKVIVGMNGHNEPELNYARNLPIIEAKQFILLEKTEDIVKQKHMEEYGLKFSSYDDYEENCYKYVKDKKERDRLVELNYSYFKKYCNFDDMIKNVDIVCNIKNIIKSNNRFDLISKPLKYSINCYRHKKLKLKETDTIIDLVFDFAVLKQVTGIHVTKDNPKFEFIINIDKDCECEIWNKKYKLLKGDNKIIDKYYRMTKYVLIDKQVNIANASFTIF